MGIFLTGTTGFLGSYLTAELLNRGDQPLFLLLRARNPKEAESRLWRALQLHLSFDKFEQLRKTRLKLFRGDITVPNLGLDPEDRKFLTRHTESIVHCAASLNRRSYEICTNVNLKGTLEVVKLAREILADHPLKRFSNISTVAVSGHRRNEIVQEEGALRWNAPDLDAYGATKKMAEHLVRELLPETSVLTFRPSAIIGDSRFPATTQFEMVRAFAWLANIPVLPFDPTWKIDIVPADFAARAVAGIHQLVRPKFDIYHVSSGSGSLTYCQIVAALGSGRTVFLPSLQSRFDRLCQWLSERHPGWRISRMATLLKYFMPHLVENTVYDNARLVEELREAPASFGDYAAPLVKFAREHGFKYPYLPFPPPGNLEAAS